MAVGDTLPHCTGTGTEADPYIYNTAQGFLEAIAVAAAYVEAGQQNLLFDANDGIISRVVFYCAYIDGKGTTIRNLIAWNRNSNTTGDNYLIVLNNGSIVQTITNMNFYNMCVINTTGSGLQTGFIRDWNLVNDVHRNRTFRNCNFTGIFRGTPLTSTAGLIQSGCGGTYAYRVLAFYNCTFNINTNTNQASLPLTIFYGSDLDAPLLSNCVINLSGTFRPQSTSATAQHFYPIYNFKAQGCTFMNSVTNPLQFVPNVHIVEFTFGSGSGYNYIKLYMISADTNRISCKFANAATTLLNRSRITDFYLSSGTVISMQETDPTQTDYIYNETNLNNAGFLVGQVIE